MMLGMLQMLDKKMLARKYQHHIHGNELDSHFIQQGLQFIVCVSKGAHAMIAGKRLIG